MLTDFLIFWQWWLEAIETSRFFHWPFTFVLKCISKSILIKLGHPKKYLPKFPTQKNPGIENFKPQNILGSSPSLEIRSINWVLNAKISGREIFANEVRQIGYFETGIP